MKKVIVDMGNMLHIHLHASQTFLKEGFEQPSIKIEETVSGDKVYDRLNDPNLFRHLIITGLIGFKSMFHVKINDIILAFDHPVNWRKKKFEYYKQNRKKGREESNIDWEAFFGLINQFQDELIDLFPFQGIYCKYAEADDIIATIVERCQDDEFIIVSSDKDFYQLQKYKNVLYQWSTYHKSRVDIRNPKLDLLLKVMNGDAGDGIPNILSDDDTFVMEKKRQKPLGVKKAMKLVKEKKLRVMLEENPKIKSNYNRNRLLIDFDKIPSKLKERILLKYERKQMGRNKLKLLSYFREHKLSVLSGRTNEFFI